MLQQPTLKCWKVGQQEEVNLAPELLTSGAEARSGREGFLGQGRDLQGSTAVVRVADFITWEKLQTLLVKYGYSKSKRGLGKLVFNPLSPQQHSNNAR